MVANKARMLQHDASSQLKTLVSSPPSGHPCGSIRPTVAGTARMLQHDASSLVIITGQNPSSPFLWTPLWFHQEGMRFTADSVTALISPSSTPLPILCHTLEPGSLHMRRCCVLNRVIPHQGPLDWPLPPNTFKLLTIQHSGAHTGLSLHSTSDCHHTDWADCCSGPRPRHSIPCSCIRGA